MTTSIRPSGGGHLVRGDGPLLPVDVALGLARPAWRLVRGTSHAVSVATGPLVRLSLRPPGVPEPLHPARWLDALARSGAERREVVTAEVSGRLDLLVPSVLDGVLDRVDLTAVVLERVDLDAVVTTVLDRMDLTAVVLERVDLQAVVTTVLDRMDLTAVVLERVDLQAVVTTVLDRLDLTAVVLERVDLQAVVTTVLDRLDLTAVVLQRVDLEAVVSAALAQIDLVGIAEEVIDGVDLPEIIRESTGSMASDTVRGARMQGISADEAVGRAVDRLLLRHGRRGGHPPEHLAAAVASEPTVVPPAAERAP